MTALVAAASRHGATTEIAAAIAHVLRERGVETDVADVEEVASLDRYDAVVLGSAVYAGRWLAPARSFVDGHAGELADRKTWLFSSGPIGGSPEAESSVKLDEIVEKTSPEAHRVFGGKLDRKDLGRAERLVVRVVRAPTGDYRDWHAIRGYAEEIADALNG